MARRQSKSQLKVFGQRKLLVRGLDAVEDMNIPELLDVVEEIKKEGWHNPFWISIPAIAIGFMLRRSGFSLLRRLGYTLIGYGSAQSVADATQWGLDLADKIAEIKTKFGDRSAVGPADVEKLQQTGGIGEP